MQKLYKMFFNNQSASATTSLQKKIGRFFLYGSLGILLVLLCIQYWQMKTVSSRLFDLKEDYRVYTMALRKILDKKEQENNSLDQDQKKKTIDGKSAEAVVEGEELQEPFLRVNRDDDYLLSNAIAFAKKHKLAESVSQILDVEKWKETVTAPHKQQKKQKKKKKSVARATSVATKQLAAESSKAKFEKDFDFLWPIDRSNFWLSSPFGPRKLRGRRRAFHYGVDMAAIKGTPVMAAATGIVLESGYNGGYGNCILIAHNKKYKTRYAHLHKRRVKVGEKVKKGDIIGTVGDTGLVAGRNGSHLHFEVHVFGRPINPILVLM